MASEYHDRLIDRAFTEISKYVAELQAEVLRLRSASAKSVGTLQEFLPYPLEEAVSRSLDRVCKDYLERRYTESLPIVEKNNEIARNNLAVRQAFEEMLQRANIPGSVRKGWNGHGRNAKAIHGGWEDSLKAIRVSHGWEELVSRMKSRLRELEDYERRCESERRTAEHNRNTKRKKIEGVAFRMMLSQKYAIPDGDDVLYTLLGRNKYLRLAYWLERNRSDWNDGCDYALTGLNGFDVESEIDKSIALEIRSLCFDFEDGRCFRDCSWNYGRLYEMAAETDAELVADVKKLMNYSSEES